MQIKYSKKHTKNLGNYQSLTVEIGIEEEVHYEAGDTFESVYSMIRELVNVKLKKEFEKVGGM